MAAGETWRCEQSVTSPSCISTILRRKFTYNLHACRGARPVKGVGMWRMTAKERGSVVACTVVIVASTLIILSRIQAAPSSDTASSTTSDSP